MDEWPLKMSLKSSEIGLRIKKLREELSWSQTQLAEKSKLSKTYIYEIENGKKTNIGFETLENIASALHVPVLALVLGEQNIQNILDKPPNAISAPSYIPNDIPIVGLAKAGPGGFFGGDGLPVDDWSRKIHRPESVTDPHAYAIVIEGDSMEPMASKGDIFLCETDKTPRNGDRVVVQTHGGEVMAKLFYDDGKHIVLKSMNQKYEPIVLARDDIRAVHVVRWVKYK